MRQSQTVERICWEEPLQNPKPHRFRKRLYYHGASRPHSPNHTWSINFVHDKLSNQLPLKILTDIDEYTRKVSSVITANTTGSSEVLKELHPLLLQRVNRKYLFYDNGHEFSLGPFEDWLPEVGMKTIRIYPG